MFKDSILTKRGRQMKKNRRKLSKLEQGCEVALEEAKQQKSSSEVLRNIEQDWRFEMTEYWDSEALEKSRFWLQRASKFHIPRPAYDDDSCWQNSQWFNERFLTSKGIHQIRVAWREEIQWKVTVGSGVCSMFIGIGGLLVGLWVAFLSKS